MSQSSTPDSSSGGESIDVEVYDRRGEAREEMMRVMGEEMEELKRKNQELEEMLRNVRNDKMRVSDDEKDVKRRMKQLQRENQELKIRLLEMEQSYQSQQSSRQAANIDFKHKHHKLHSKTTKSKQIRQSSNASESSVAQLKIFDSTLELRKLQTQKLVLQKQLYQLKESLLIIQHQRRWSMNLADKIVGLAQKLSSVFKEDLFRRDWDMQKRAKVSWRYLKHILKYIFSDH